MAYWVVKGPAYYVAQNGAATIQQLFAKRFETKQDAQRACNYEERVVKVVRTSRGAPTMILYRILWREPIIRELHDGRVVWLVQTCERWALSLVGADQIIMDLRPYRRACMLTHVVVAGMDPQWLKFVDAWDDSARVEAWV